MTWLHVVLMALVIAAFLYEVATPADRSRTVPISRLLTIAALVLAVAAFFTGGTLPLIGAVACLALARLV